ncbi:hypothetical protein AAG570_006010 [Ranatra chinensis]|uniref:Proteasome subunit alpha type n=1 Tax=Ranatra chinensis TaxID=642074 RepID=A0ABD0XZD8_9HEMI
MFRNHYDSDVTVWSPQGRLHQVEYAMEATKLGSAAVGVKNSSHAVLVALKRAASELSSYQKKIVPIDAHVGVAITGLTSDARRLCRLMRTRCQTHTYNHDDPIPVCRLMSWLATTLQLGTQRYDRRPAGVGFLVAGYDDGGPHVYSTCPSANIHDCQAMAMGSRSQSAKTYLEKHLNSMLGTTADELILHGLRALRETMAADNEMTARSISIAIVGKDTPFETLDEGRTASYLEKITGERGERGGTGRSHPDSEGGDQETASQQ